MKKVNNKGFAISALIYSLATIALLTLLLILGTLSGMRKNESSLVDNVKEELNLAGRKGNVFTDTTKILRYKVPVGTVYNFKLWGGSGGSPGSSNTGGLGGYVEFNREVSAGTILYILVGNMGACPSDHEANFGTDFTTGGAGHCSNSLGSYVCGCSGGGASVVFVGDEEHVPSTIEDLVALVNSNNLQILGVAGGGGGAGLIDGYAAHATGTIPVTVPTVSLSPYEPEVQAGNVGGTSATVSAAGKLNVAGNIGAGSLLMGGTIPSHYYKWAGSTFGSEQDGYAGAGGGGGYYGGGAASGSYVGAGGGSNFIAGGTTGAKTNLGGGEAQPKKDNTGEYVNNFEDKFGNGKVIITRE